MKSPSRLAQSPFSRILLASFLISIFCTSFTSAASNDSVHDDDATSSPTEELKRVELVRHRELQNCLKNFNIPDGKRCDRSLISQEEARLKSTIAAAAGNAQKIPLRARIRLAKSSCLEESNCARRKCICQRSCKPIVMNSTATCEKENLAYVKASAAANGFNITSDGGPDTISVTTRPGPPRGGVDNLATGIRHLGFLAVLVYGVSVAAGFNL